MDSFVVTHLLNAGDILALSDYVCSTGIQISEQVDVSIVKDVRNHTRKKIIKTVVVGDEASVECLKSYEIYADFLLLDTQKGGYVGGTGETSDWKICSEMAALSQKPVYLAGGLTPENVELGILTVRPAGVDVSTGISTYSANYLRKDRKDPEKIRSFVNKARAAGSQMARV